MFSEKEAQKIIKDIFNGSNDIPTDMYQRTFEKLSEGISTGYGDPKDGTDLDMIYHLKNNVKVFSAFKANHFKDTMIGLLVDEKQQQRTWGSFLKEAKKVDKDYNTQWLAAEYNMAIRQARGAKQWSTFERDKEVYPNLQYMPSRSADPRQAHSQYYGIILPIGHPFWNYGYPPLDWGCKCWVQQTQETATDFSQLEEQINTPSGLAGNAGKEKRVFTADSSYLSGLTKNEKLDVRQFMRDHADLGYEEMQIKVGKNKITVPIDADPNDLIQNIDYLKPFVKKYKEDYGINSHIIKQKQKNPELNQDGVIGDLTGWETSKTAKGFIETNWSRKYKVQMKDSKKIFIAFDFNGKLNKDNYMEMWRSLNGKMDINKEKNRAQFVLLKNNNKIVKIMNDVNRKKEGIKLIEKELL